MGKLVQVATETVTSPVAYVDLIGTTTDDVYMIAFNNVQPASDATQLICRVLASSSPDTSSNYDRAWKSYTATSTFGNQYGVNESFTYISGGQAGTGTSETNQGILYLYNFNDTSEYSFVSVEGTNLNYNQVLVGIMGGWVHTVNQSCNGLRMFFASGNIASGTFTLYKVI